MSVKFLSEIRALSGALARTFSCLAFVFAINSRAEAAPPVEACGEDYTRIYTIQGNGLASALDGSEVATEGVVVGDFADGKNGFFLQDADNDGDTSDDIVINPDGTFSLRAERSGTGDGRIYTITYQATDASGNSVTASAEVIVPLGKGVQF